MSSSSFITNTAAEVVTVFNRIYYNVFGSSPNPFHKFQWMGVPVLKCPEDLWAFQEIVVATKPDVIVECGVAYGGTTLYLAHLCDIVGNGIVVGCDVDLAGVADAVRAHPRISLLVGSSVSSQVFSRVESLTASKRTMVILDSDHRELHVSEELRLYSKLVSDGCYLVVEDTNLNGRPVAAQFGPGPGEAVDKFLLSDDRWRVDPKYSGQLLTFNPGGYLVRK